jgi:hypothetical protein
MQSGLSVVVLIFVRQTSDLHGRQIQVIVVQSGHAMHFFTITRRSDCLVLACPR